MIGDQTRADAGAEQESCFGSGKPLQGTVRLLEKVWRGFQGAQLMLFVQFVVCYSSMCVHLYVMPGLCTWWVELVASSVESEFGSLYLRLA